MHTAQQADKEATELEAMSPINVLAEKTQQIGATMAGRDHLPSSYTFSAQTETERERESVHPSHCSAATAGSFMCEAGRYWRAAPSAERHQ